MNKKLSLPPFFKKKNYKKIMLAKFTLICIIYSVTERHTTDHIVREVTVILRRETNINLKLKIIIFFSKSSLY